MSAWLTEKEFRQGGAESLGVTINVAFLQEIKEDFGFRDLLNSVYYKFKPVHSGDLLPRPHEAAQLLGDLRDELETYFALEDFYGYFNQSTVNNPRVAQAAGELRGDHERLFLKLNRIVELTEQIAYQEIGPESTIGQVADALEDFCVELAGHEQAEMDLMMRLCNEEIGVGD
jgi:iron-sulfur cluster repair protein YtfE (RIC family)